MWAALLDQAGARRAAGHRLLTGDFHALETGPLVNIDHNTRFLILRFRRSNGGACEVCEATIRSSSFSGQSRDRQSDTEVPQRPDHLRQGEEADRVFYVQSGKVKVTVVSEQGKEAVVGILDKAQFFGEGCLNGQAVRVGTARAMEESVITSITRKAMLATLRKEPRFSELFVTYLVTRSNRIEEDLIDQLFNSSEKRLARLLLLLANFGKNGKPTPIDASINQATLAEMIGTTRPRVSYFLNKFRKLGLISYNGKIEVHRSLLNAVLYEKPQLEREEKPT
jgi:CRP/FNR family cyclic AMP-dependent transcriptional regulator